jgi:hypothetical protein
MFTIDELEAMKNEKPRYGLGGLNGISLSRPADERLEIISTSVANPYRYISSRGLPVKLNHRHARTLDEALYEHFSLV